MRIISILALVLTFFSWSIGFAKESPNNVRFAAQKGVSRNSGVAPLSVHFKADYKPSSSTERGFHNYDYTWNFGDTSSGNWGTTGKSKNAAKGPVAAHVYETPGIYTATLTVRNATGVIKTNTFAITVSDPDVIYSGTKTTCISDTAHSDFSGCPTGAARVTTDDLSRISNYIGAGRRVLLDRGSSWSSGGINMPNNSGPVTIGAYGTCIDPDELGICSNAPQVNMSGTFCDMSNKQDWRITDLSFAGPRGTGGVLGGIINVQRILALRLKATGMDGHIGMSHWKESPADLIDHYMIVSCNFFDATNNSVYIGAERLALLGNKIDKVSDSHVVRVWQGYLAVISHNLISGSSIDSNTGRHALKFHGPGEEEYCPSGAGTCLNHRTNFAVISDNTFGSSGPWPVAIGPADGGHNCLVSDVIFERNRIHPDFGTKSNFSSPVQVGVSIWARYITVRNNIIDGTKGYDGFIGLRISRRGIEPPPLGVEVYNNTFYRQNESGITNSHVGIDIAGSASGTIVRNNLASFQTVGSGGTAIIQNASDDLQQSNNLMTLNPGLVNPDLANPLSRNYTPQSGSQPDEAGTPAVPVFDDYKGNPRLQDDGAYDVGAFEN